MGLLYGNASFVEYTIANEVEWPEFERMQEIFNSRRISPLCKEDTRKESFGWCNPFTGDNDDVVKERMSAYMIGFRIDTKKVPKVTLSLAVQEMRVDLEREEGAKTAEFRRKLKELRATVEEKMLGDFLPSVKFVEVYIDLTEGKVYFGSISNSLNDKFKMHLFDTAGMTLLRKTYSTSPMIEHGVAMESIVDMVPMAWGV